jgi:hypothetical protein
LSSGDAEQVTGLRASDGPPKIRRGPAIKVTCECGEVRSLHYGERWQCEKCARRYDTSRIPIAEYNAVRDAHRRRMLIPLAVALIVLVGAAALVITGRPLAAVIIVPGLGYIWAQWIRPARRDKQRAELADLPRWEIKAE